MVFEIKTLDICNKFDTYIFKIYQNILFLYSKTEKFKIAIFSLYFILVYKMWLFSTKKSVSIV